MTKGGLIYYLCENFDLLVILGQEMKGNKEVKISYWAAHLTTIVSVSLVLILIGTISLITISAARESNKLREKLEVSLVLADSVSDATATSLAKEIEKQSYSHSVKVITKEEALKNWKKDTGEDLEALFGVNPLSPEITFGVTSEYSGESELKKISAVFENLPIVEGVALPDAGLVDTMNRNIGRFAMILGIIALVMIVISFVLINNTVHLAIYARRFTIHTMQLVGATNGFIRRPFVNNNMLSGLISGLIASGFIGMILGLAPRFGFRDISDYISWEVFAIVAVSLTGIGIIICALAAILSTTRYLRQDYDELFR